MQYDHPAILKSFSESRDFNLRPLCQAKSKLFGCRVALGWVGVFFRNCLDGADNLISWPYILYPERNPPCLSGRIIIPQVEVKRREYFLKNLEISMAIDIGL